MGNKCYVPEIGGESLSFAVGDPAAGANWSFTIPAGYEYEIRSIQTKLTTSVAVANRQSRFVVNDAGANELWHLYFSQVIVASFAAWFSLFVGDSRSNYYLLVSALNSQYNDVVPDCRLLPGYTIGPLFTALDGADQFSSTRILAHRWKTN